MKTLSEYIAVTSLIVISFLFRWYLISDYHISFWFDQSRDAYISQKIISEQDIKIQGPSASGTNDTIYHGVLYYYIIAPFYYFFGGDPTYPSLLLSFIGSLAIIPIYYLVKDISGSHKAGYFASLLFAFSAEAAQMSNWLSNPSIALPIICLFYLTLWKCCFQKQRTNFWFIVMLICLGLGLQSAIWLVYLWGALTIGLYSLTDGNWRLLFRHVSKSTIVIGLLLFFLTIASLIVTQLKLAQAGVFTPQTLFSSMGRNELFNLANLTGILTMYTEKILKSIFPPYPILSFLFLLLLLLRMQLIEKSTRLLLIIWLSAPLWLLAIHTRNTIHALIGIEIALYVFISIWIWRNKAKDKMFIIGFAVMFIASNIAQVQGYRATRTNTFTPQNGVFLKDQLSLIDTTYKLAKSQPFSISSFTNPYGYNITWAYLYNWYGKNKFGYIPTFYGYNQTGLFGEGLLRQTNKPDDIHFTIIEPNTGTPQVIFEEFTTDQNHQAGLITEELSFGSLKLQQR